MLKAKDGKTKLVRKLLLNILLVLAIAFTTAGLVVTQPEERIGPIATLSGRTFALDIADTNAEREQGLSDRKSLGEDKAMLFVFDEAGEYCFWMKDMHFAIDMIWLDSNQRVVYVQENARPESYPDLFCPSDTSKYVLETNAGVAKELDIRVGDQVRLQLD